VTSPRVQRIIETCTNVIVVLTCVFVCAYLLGWIPIRRSELPDPTYRPGEVVERIPGRPWVTSPRTLVLAVRSTCRFCSESVPFYRQVFQIARDQHLPVVTVSADPESVTREFLSLNGLSPDGVHAVGRDSRLAARTPTIALVDAGGKAIACWTGRLNAAQEKEVDALIKGGRPAATP